MIFTDNHRADKVNPDHLFTINQFGVQNTEDIIKDCAKEQGQSRIEYSSTEVKNLNNNNYQNTSEDKLSARVQSFFHINFSSSFWGFVDDMSIGILDWQQFKNNQTFDINDNVPSAIGVQIQSQLRVGEYDFDVNPTRVADFYECLSSRIDKSFISDKGSIWRIK